MITVRCWADTPSFHCDGELPDSRAALSGGDFVAKLDRGNPVLSLDDFACLQVIKKELDIQ